MRLPGIVGRLTGPLSTPELAAMRVEKGPPSCGLLLEVTPGRSLFVGFFAMTDSGHVILFGRRSGAGRNDLTVHRTI
jgi:hypothetical protein